MSERQNKAYTIERKYLGKVSPEEFVGRIVKSHMVGNASESSSLEEYSGPQNGSFEKEVPT